VDSNLIIAIVTSICTAGSTAGVAITALTLSNKRIDRVEVALDKINTSLEMLTGSMHDIGRRLSIMEDRMSSRN
jgi:hypothetical protein